MYGTPKKRCECMYGKPYERRQCVKRESDRKIRLCVWKADRRMLRSLWKTDRMMTLSVWKADQQMLRSVWKGVRRILQYIVCSGSVVVTASDFESGRPGSNPEWGLICYIWLRSLHRAHQNLHLYGVVQWVPEQLNIKAVSL